MKRSVMGLLCTVLLTGCPDTQRYESDDASQVNAGGRSADGVNTNAGGQDNAPTARMASNAGGITMTPSVAGDPVIGGRQQANRGGHDQGAKTGGASSAGQATPGPSSGGGISDAVGGTTASGGQGLIGGGAAGAPSEGGAVGGNDATMPTGDPNNPFNTPTGGLGDLIDIPDTCVVSFTVELPVWTPPTDVYLAGTFKWPGGTGIPAPNDTNEWKANGDCDLERVQSPDALKCNWNPADPDLRMTRSGLTATLDIELPHLAEVDYKFTRGAWCTVEKRVRDCQEVTNRKQIVNCGGPQQNVTDVVEQWFDTCPNSGACN
ncbi:MAG: hypothetical protein VX589_18085 [Myxococcota bacterium]|nr:hypothetical protein [Myxococcota bacterium]